MGGCGRFEWIWLDLGGLELIRADSGTQAAHGALWGLFRNHSEWKIIPNDELFRSLSVMVQNDIKTYRLEHLDGPPKIIQNDHQKLQSERPWTHCQK